MTTQRTAFVSGATGCIGGALVERLLAGGWDVIEMNRREKLRATATGKARSVNAELPGTAPSKAAVSEAMRGVDAVFHLAALVHAAPERDEADFVRVNVDGTRFLLDAAIAGGASHFVFFSTVAVYGEHSGVADETVALTPVTAYARSKVAAEEIVLAAADRIRVTVLRLPVVYGLNDRGNVGKLIRQIRRRRFVLVGEGKNRKSMIAAENAADAALLAVEKEAPSGSVYNVCDARDYSIAEVANAIARALGRQPNFVKVPTAAVVLGARLADGLRAFTGVRLPVSLEQVRKLTTDNRCDSSRIEKELGYFPRISLDMALPRIVQDHALESHDS